MSQAPLFLSESMEKIIYTHAQGEVASREQYLFPLKNVSVGVGAVRDVG